MHHISNVKVENPVVLLLQPQIIAHRYFEVFDPLQLLNLRVVVKTDVQLFTLSYEVFPAVSFVKVYISLFGILLLCCQLLELVYD